MRVVLTRPRYHTFLIAPPLGMGYVSSYLRSRGHETLLLDALNLDLGSEEIVAECRRFGARIVGIYLLSPSSSLG